MTSYWGLTVLIAICCVDCKATSMCEQKMAVSYLDTAVYMIAKVKSTIPAGSPATCTCEVKIAASYLNTAVDMITNANNTIQAGIGCENNITRRALDCSELLEMGYNASGVYTIWPADKGTDDKSLKVYCDMQTNGGGWTVIQRRGNFQRPVDYFYKDWKSYKEGFGDIEEDFWLGNDNIFALTNQKNYSVRFDLKDVENNYRYAEYSTFRIDDENHQYTLHVGKYTGDAGDSLYSHDNQKFSTKDRDNDPWEGSCAQKFKGAWWYHDGCHNSNLNGMYYRGKHDSHADGVNWGSWKGFEESLESTEIKIRPKSNK